MPYFGQPPLAASLPLAAGQNLADLPNKTSARSNLDVFSRDEALLHGVPIGTIIPFWGSVAPAGYLPCYGQTVNSSTYPELVAFLGGTTSASLPDLRGEFLRGWDNGRGIDAGRAVKSWQADELKSHTHSIPYTDLTFAISSSSGTSLAYASSPKPTGATGGVETRPRNIAVLYCIKAYGAISNSGTVDAASLFAELSSTAKLSQFESSKAASGYQKLPGGMILQWGTVASIAANTSTAVTLPLAYPTAHLMVLAGSTAGNLNTAGNNGGTSADAKTLTGFSLYNGWDSVTQNPVAWISLGY